MVYEVISAKEALEMAKEARKHYREEERLALLRYVDADIKDACKTGELSTTVEVEEEDFNFLISFLEEKGYSVEGRPLEGLNKIEICWD